MEFNKIRLSFTDILFDCFHANGVLRFVMMNGGEGYQCETLVGRGSVVIVTADVDSVSRTLAGPWKACGDAGCDNPLVRLLFLGRAIRWSGLSLPHCLLRAVNVTRLRFQDSSVSFAVASFSVTLPYTWHFRINLSQLSVIAAAKVSHFKILCHVHDIKPTVRLFRCFYVNSKNKGWMSFSKRSDNAGMRYTKPLDSLKHWNVHFFWIDAFACPASFPWHTDKNIVRDPLPKSSEFNASDYAVLVAYPASFRKYPKPFICLVGISSNYTLDEDTYPIFLHDNDEDMNLLAFIHHTDPTKVKIGERERAEGEAKLLDSTVGRVV
ncbi:hypothetical protein Tco_0786827, partial [Tanacetum coccineum]